MAGVAHVLLGWCMTGHHSLCRTRVSNDRGAIACSCFCHLEEAAA